MRLPHHALLKSFFVCRLVMGRATANINRILLSVVTEMDQAKLIDEGVRGYLSTGRKYYAADPEIRAAALTIRFNLTVGRASTPSQAVRTFDDL